MKALGFIETRSLSAAIEASDEMLKAADVALIGTEKIGSGLVNVIIEGDVAAVQAAVDVGCQVVNRSAQVYAVHVIPNPDASITNLIPKFKEDLIGEKEEA